MLSKHGFTPGFIDNFVPRLKESYQVISVSTLRNILFRQIDMIWSLLRNQKKADYVLIDTFSTLNFYYAFILSVLSNRLSLRYIPILRGGNLPSRLKSNPRMCKFIFQNSYKNISPSLYLQHHFQKAGYNAEYIPNFIDIENYQFIKRTKISPKILWVRSFHKIYNPQMAIQVFSKLSVKYPNAELCMVGPDKDGTMELCKDLAKILGIFKNITFTGILSKEDWVSRSADYDIFLNTTNFDNMPVSVIEAMALGFPIVSTNAGGLKYLHKNGVDALLVEKNDIDGMVNKILSILDDNQLAESLSLNARRKAETFDWDCIKYYWLKLLG